MDEMYTINDAVRITGYKKRHVQDVARKLGMRIWANRYVLSREDVNRIAKEAYDQPGRPKLLHNR